jgi:alpha-tubulin suppressor-like RCC1 family protein
MLRRRRESRARARSKQVSRWRHYGDAGLADRSSVSHHSPTGACDADEWEDVVALAAGSYHTIGATASRRVLAAGGNSHGQRDVGGWQDIVVVAAGSTHTLGLRADSTVVSAGNNASCQCEVGSWPGIQVPGARA